MMSSTRSSISAASEALISTCNFTRYGSRIPSLLISATTPAFMSVKLARDQKKKKKSQANPSINQSIKPINQSINQSINRPDNHQSRRSATNQHRLSRRIKTKQIKTKSQEKKMMNFPRKMYPPSPAVICPSAWAARSCEISSALS